MVAELAQRDLINVQDSIGMGNNPGCPCTQTREVLLQPHLVEAGLAPIVHGKAF